MDKMETLRVALRMLSKAGLTIAEEALLGGYGEFRMYWSDSTDCGIGEYSCDGVVIHRISGEIVFDGSWRMNANSVRI